MIARRLTASTFTGATLSLALAVVVLATSVPARAAADEDVPLDSKILRGLMEAIGLRKDGDGINYQERAPLVIPPSRALPPPEKSDAVAANNPAWPKDPDVQRAKDDAALARSESRWAGDKIIKEQSVLRGNDMTPGPKPRTASRAAKPDSYWNNDDPRLKPSELGYKGGFFSKMFGGKDEETAKFTGEPPRASLTEPPPGYRTPSPDQPYGLDAKETAPKAVDYMTTHGEGTK